LTTQRIGVGSPASQETIWLIGPKRLSNRPGDDRRDHHRQDEERHEHLPPGHALEEQEGQQEAQGHLDRQRDREEDQGVQQGLPEAQVVE
jgi:hypothetical protein